MIERLRRRHGSEPRIAEAVKVPVSTVTVFQHAAIDDASRVAYGEVLPSEPKEDVVEFRLRVVAFFEGWSVKISRLMTDNGLGYRSKLLARPLQAFELRHIFVRSYRHSKDRTAAPYVWLRYYNCVRRHQDIGRLSPFQRLVELG